MPPELPVSLAVLLALRVFTSPPSEAHQSSSACFSLLRLFAGHASFHRDTLSYTNP